MKHWNELTPKQRKIVIAAALALLFGIAAKFGIDVSGELDKTLDTVERVDGMLSETTGATE